METKNSRETDSPEELLDLVDERDQVIDTVTREEVYRKGLRNYRVIHAFIKNSEGKIWIPRRVATKKLYPNGLDYSIAGHVESGESYDDALLKEASEEVNMDLKDNQYRKIGYFTPYTHDVHCFQTVYEVLTDTVPEYNREDFSDYEWLLPEEIVSRYADGEIGKEDVPEVVKLCYLNE
jgi:isopentenyl-diphosphate delta-isomerase